MKIAVVYESIFGNTHEVSTAIAEGAGRLSTVVLLPVVRADAAALADADVVIIGAPTHAMSMSTPATRDQGAGWARDPAKALTLDVDTSTTGIREWLAAADRLPGAYAAFDTRVDFMKIMPGAVSGIDRAMRRRKATRLAPVRSFAVTKANTLKPGERDRAVAWGEELARVAAEVATPTG